jgi:hypothetical protein
MFESGFHVGDDHRLIALVEVFENTTHGGMGSAVSAGACLMGLDASHHE